MTARFDDIYVAPQRDEIIINFEFFMLCFTAWLKPSGDIWLSSFRLILRISLAFQPFSLIPMHQKLLWLPKDWATVVDEGAAP